jgi:hypothetical protein
MTQFKCNQIAQAEPDPEYIDYILGIQEGREPDPEWIDHILAIQENREPDPAWVEQVLAEQEKGPYEPQPPMWNWEEVMYDNDESDGSF